MTDGRQGVSHADDSHNLEHVHDGHAHVHGEACGHLCDRSANAHDGHTHEHGQSCRHEHDGQAHVGGAHAGHSHAHGDTCTHGDGLWAYLPHGHGLSSRIASDRRSLQLACVILFVSLSVKLLSGMVAHSSVFEVEAVHTLLDGLVILLSLLTITLASWPTSPGYSYGYARAEVLSALVSVLALALMCAHLLLRALQSSPGAWRAATGEDAVWKGKAVMFAEAVTLTNNVQIALVLGRNAESLNVRALRAHVVGDSIGNVVVLLGGFALWLHPRATILDPVLTIVVVVAILVLNVGLARETFEVLMQAAPEGMEAPVLERAMKRIHGVKQVEDCHVWTVTSGVVVASVKVVVDEDVVERGKFQTVQEKAEGVLRNAGADEVTVQASFSTPGVSTGHGRAVVDHGVMEDVVVHNRDSEHYALLESEEE